MVNSTKTLEPLYEADIPTAVSLLFAMMHYTAERKLFADTPVVRQWWHDIIRTDLLQQRNQTYLKVMEKGKMVAFAKWDMSKPDNSISRFSSWPPEINSEAWEQLMKHILRERKRVMGSRRHYYLDMLAIHPAYQGTEAASTLLWWGCRQADCDRVYVYTDASIDESRLFEKFDFLDYSSPVFDNWLVPMMRIPAASTESEW